MEREPVRTIIAFLALEPSQVNGSPVDSRRRACLEALYDKSKTLKCFSDCYGVTFAGSSRGNLGVQAQMDETSKESPGCEDDARSLVPPAVLGGYPANRTLVENQAARRALRKFKCGELFQYGTHGAPIKSPVALRARGPDCRPFRPVQHAKLDSGQVGGAADDASEGVHLRAQPSPLRFPRIAGLLASI